MSDKLVIYAVWAWRVPYKLRYAILRSYVGKGELIEDTTAMLTATDLEPLQLYLMDLGLVKFMRHPTDHPSLIETWL